MKELLFSEDLKTKIDELKEKTLHELISEDEQYQENTKEQRAAEKAYLKLHLTKEEREVTDRLLSLADAGNMEYSTLSYVAGLLDSKIFMKVLNTSIDTDETNNNLLCQFYSGDLLPQELLKESPATIKQWNELDEKEQELNSILNESQKKLFKVVMDKRQEVIASLIKDSFISYFRLGVKLVMEIK